MYCKIAAKPTPFRVRGYVWDFAPTRLLKVISKICQLSQQNSQYTHSVSQMEEGTVDVGLVFCGGQLAAASCPAGSVLHPPAVLVPEALALVLNSLLARDIQAMRVACRGEAWDLRRAEHVVETYGDTPCTDTRDTAHYGDAGSCGGGVGEHEAMRICALSPICFRPAKRPQDIPCTQAP